MDEERLIKSDRRVKAHGEVFTPKRIVKQMLETSSIQPELSSLVATFLEPAAGEGAFLIEILLRKLKLADDLSHSISDFEQNALISLMSLYGIELLIDNAELLAMHMYQVFYQEYFRQLSKYHAPKKKSVLKSALTIIQANMVQGDALTGKNKNGDDIIFSQWNLLRKQRGVQKVQRTEYTFDAIKNDGPSIDGQQQVHGAEELSLFDLEDPIIEAGQYRYAVVSLPNIYKESKILVTDENNSNKHR